MNEDRRKELRRAIAFIDEARAVVEKERDAEQEAYDNLPESMQDADKGQTMQSNAEALGNVVDKLEEAVSEIEETF